MELASARVVESQNNGYLTCRNVQVGADCIPHIDRVPVCLIHHLQLMAKGIRTNVKPATVIPRPRTISLIAEGMVHEYRDIPDLVRADECVVYRGWRRRRRLYIPHGRTRSQT